MVPNYLSVRDASRLAGLPARIHECVEAGWPADEEELYRRFNRCLGNPEVPPAPLSWEVDVWALRPRPGDWSGRVMLQALSDRYLDFAYPLQLSHHTRITGLRFLLKAALALNEMLNNTFKINPESIYNQWNVQVLLDMDYHYNPKADVKRIIESLARTNRFISPFVIDVVTRACLRLGSILQDQVSQKTMKQFNANSIYDIWHELVSHAGYASSILAVAENDMVKLSPPKFVEGIVSSNPYIVIRWLITTILQRFSEGEIYDTYTYTSDKWLIFELRRLLALPPLEWSTKPGEEDKEFLQQVKMAHKRGHELYGSRHPVMHELDIIMTAP